MTLGVKDIFAKAGAYVGYCFDVISIAPSDKVKARLQEQGYRFKASEYMNTIIEAPSLPGAISLGLPLEVVMTERGVNIYKFGDKATINRYETAKKEAAASVRGLKVSP